MSTIVEILGSDEPKNSRTDINNNFTNLNADKIQSGDTVGALTVTDLTVTNFLGGSTTLAGDFYLLTVIDNPYAYGFRSRKRGRNGDPGATPQNGSELGGLYLQGWNGTAYSNTACGIVGVTSEDWTDVAEGSRLQFYTTPVGTLPNQWSAVLDAAGNFDLLNSAILGFSSSSTDPSTPDTGIARNAPGVLEVNSGTKGTLRDISVRNVLTALTTPASAAATGVAGTICADANFLYVCTATNTWKRVAISTW